MPLVPAGATEGGSGGGLLLRTPPDNFSAATRSAAETARDAAITNVAAELADFTANPNLAIILTITGSDPDTTVYQVRRGNSWADVTNAVTGPRGPGPTDQQVTAGVQAGVKPFARSGGPQVPDSEIPAEITRDTEITRSFLLNILGLTAQELNDLFVGATVSGTGAARTITVTQADGSTITLVVPDTGDGGGGGGGSADGVVSGAAFAADGTTLTLTLSTGATVTANVPAALRQMGVTVQLELNPPTIPARVTTAKTYNLSIEHPANLYPAADMVQVTVDGASPKRAAYSPAMVHQVVSFEITASEADNLASNGNLDDGDFLNIEVRIQTGTAGAVAFRDTLRVPVATAPTASVALTDDAVLDLAQATRTAADRAKFLGTSTTDENALALLSAQSASVNNRSANYQVLASDVGNTVRLTGGTARTFTLPNIAGDVPVGSIIFFVNAATAALTLDGNGADTIDGSATLVVLPGESVEVQAVTSTAWALLSDTTSGEPLAWTTIPLGTPIGIGQVVIHNGGYYGAIVSHSRISTGPDGDSTNWILLSNWRGDWTDTWYPQGSFVRHAGLPYAATQNVSRGDPAPNASTNTKWLALGSLPRTVVVASSNTAIPSTADGDTYVHTGSSNITYTLPAASGGSAVPNGWEVVVSNQGSGDLTIDGNGADTINGEATLVITDNGRSVRLQKITNSAWVTIADTKDESGTAGSPDLRGSFATAATPAAQDRFFFTDENQSGDPVRYVTFNNLRDALANLPTVVNVSTDTAIPSTAHGDTYRVTGNTSRTITLPDPDDLTVGFFVRVANGSVSVSHSVAREGVGQTIEGGNGPVTVGAGEVLTLQLVNSNEWEAIADTTKGAAAFTPTKSNLYDAVKAILVHNSAVTADDADDELDIAIGGAASIDDNSIAPIKALAGTAAQKKDWRERLASSSIGLVANALPAVASHNTGDTLIIGRGGATVVPFREVDAPATELTATVAGDVMMLLAAGWSRIGNLFSGGIAAAAALEAANSKISRDDLPPFASIFSVPQGIDGDDFPTPFELFFSERITGKAISAIVVTVGGQVAQIDATTPLSRIAGTAVDSGSLRFALQASQINNIASNITANTNSVDFQVRFTFSDGTSYLHTIPFPVNNIVFAPPSPRVQTVTPTATAVTLNYSNGSAVQLNMNRNVTLNLGGGVHGQSMLVQTVQDTTGNRTLTLNAAVQREGRAAPVLSTAANARDYLYFYRDAAAWKYLGVIKAA